jgi:hypothetical protein
MKKAYYFVLLIVIAFNSCKKNDLSGDNGCISRIKKHYVSASDSLAAIQLLKQNNLPYTNLTFEYVLLNDTVNDPVTPYQHVVAHQNFNGLPILSSEFGYHFQGGVYKSTTGTIYGPINLNNHSSLSLPVLRKLYLDEVKKNSANIATFKDSCLVAEFGYYNLNETINTTPNFVKAWRVTPSKNNFPLVYFRDDNGKTISFFSGIVLY